jgi:hypothetical protein
VDCEARKNASEKPTIGAKEMMKQILPCGNSKQKNEFQVLFLRNDSSQEVEVYDVKRVDFQAIQERLKQGESVFITSKPAQKVSGPKPKASSASLKTRVATAFALDTS